MKDTKLKGASEIAKAVRDDHGAPRGAEKEDGSRIHSSGPSAEYSSLMPEILSDGRTEFTPTQFLKPQHANFEAPAYGGGEHRFSMDNVDRGGEGYPYPETPILDSRFMGVQDFVPVRPDDEPGANRPVRPPIRKAGGRRS